MSLSGYGRWSLAAMSVVLGFVLVSKEPLLPVAKAQEASSPQVAAVELREQGINFIKGGYLDKGISSLMQASKADPKDKLCKEALKIAKDYEAIFQTSEKQRLAELQDTVNRIEHCFLAHRYLLGLKDDKAQAKIREAHLYVVTEFYAAPTSVTLTDTSPADAKALKVNALKSINDSINSLKKGDGLLPDESSDYVAQVRKTSAGIAGGLADLRKAWEAMDLDNDEGIAAGVRALQGLEDKLMDQLSDLEGLVSKEPWRMGLVQARLARQIALPSDKISEQKWYKELISFAETKGQQSIKDAKWLDALYAYSSLEELDSDNEEYAEQSRLVRSHVRVLRLYGGPDADKSQPDTSTSKPAAPPFDYHDLTKDVDAEMVRTAISKINDRYVTAPDFRKITRGALLSIKVLAETPQASYSFEGLKDDAKRKEFVAGIDKMIDGLDDKARVDYTDLQYKLNSVLRLSAKTVDIPVEVLVMEYADALLEETDRFSSMIWPQSIDAFMKGTMGTFCGVGIQITKDDGKPLKVVTPLPGSPAYDAKIKPGDLIIAVDGEKTEDKDLDKLVQNIMGEEGTKVVLTIRRRGADEDEDVTLIRKRISIQTVKGWSQDSDGNWDFMLDSESKIGYIRVTQFTEPTVRETVAALKQLKAKGCRSLILDLRHNPGGLLDAAAKLADEFIEDDRTIVSTRGRQATPIEAKAGDEGAYQDGDLVVLVNDQSASAAEIVSGALKDLNRAVIVGNRSYGKGSVQNLLPIEEKRAILKLTTAYYYLPSGRCLHRRPGDKEWGVDPDFKVLMTPKQVKHWLDIRSRTDLLTDADPQQLQADLKLQLKADTQLNNAMMILRLMQLQDHS